jgi:hypothetical protein
MPPQFFCDSLSDVVVALQSQLVNLSLFLTLIS